MTYWLLKCPSCGVAIAKFTVKPEIGNTIPAQGTTLLGIDKEAIECEKIICPYCGNDRFCNDGGILPMDFITEVRDDL